MFPKLDPLLHSELRLAVMSILAGVDEADFTYLKRQTGATSGNLSVQIDKLTTAGYITMEKGFKGGLLPRARKPLVNMWKRLKNTFRRVNNRTKYKSLVL